MRVTPPRHRRSADARQMVRRILAAARRRDRFLVTGHVRSDGDALGSQLAFHRMLQLMGKTSHVVCDRGVSPEYRWLPGAADVRGEPADLRPPYGAAFVFDSGSWQRLERIGAALDRDSLLVVNVDHHASNNRFGDINWIDPSFSSSGEMVWEIVKASGIPVDRAIALNVYTAVVTDTGGFAFSNTTVETLLNAAELVAAGVRPNEVTRMLHRQKSMEQLRFMAAVVDRIRRSPDGRVAWAAITRGMERRIGFSPGETQEYVNLLMQLKETEVAILLREVEKPRGVKVSWRTGPGVDGIELARPFGGGGHPRASGATLAGASVQEATRRVVRAAVDYLRRRRRSTRAPEAAASPM